MPGISTVPILGSTNVQASAAYWCDTLGFTLVARFDDPDGDWVYAILRMDDAAVHLQMRREGWSPGPRDEADGDAYVYVTDVDGLYTRHLANGVRVNREVCDEEYGMRDYTVETPDGHRVSFGSSIT